MRFTGTTEFPLQITSSGFLERATPFIDAGALTPADLSLVDLLAHRFPPQAPDVLLALALALAAPARGHVGVDLLTWVAPSSDSKSEPTPQLPPQLPADRAAWQAAVFASPLVGSFSDAPSPLPTPFVTQRAGSRTLLALRRMLHEEHRIAHELLARAASAPPPIVDLDLHLSRVFANIDATQARHAVFTSATHSLTIITGGPGTGKTFSIKRLLALLLSAAPPERPLRIALAAPTGKAATRMAQALGEGLDLLPADPAVKDRLRSLVPSTLHRLLGARPDGSFARDRQRPLAADVVVVDEASMVDVRLTRALLQATPAAARLILLGDRDQLASVEAGSVFSDIVLAATRATASPLATSLVRFTHSYRFAASPDLAAAAAHLQDASQAEALAPAETPLAVVSDETPSAVSSETSPQLTSLVPELGETPPHPTSPAPEPGETSPHLTLSAPKPAETPLAVVSDETPSAVSSETSPQLTSLVPEPGEAPPRPTSPAPEPSETSPAAADIAAAVALLTGRSHAPTEWLPSRLTWLGAPAIAPSGAPYPTAAHEDALAAPYLSADVLADPRSRPRPGYAALLRDLVAASGARCLSDPAVQLQLLAALDHYRVLCVHRQGRLGVAQLEAALALRVRTFLGALPRASSPTHWLGQPILITKNAYDLRLMNGDVGLVLPDAAGGWVAVFPPLMAASVSQAPDPRPHIVGLARLPSHEGALTMTVHKSQGSQFDRVALVLAGRDSPIQTRELIYTALTRAKSRCDWLGSEAELIAALTRTVERATSLDTLLHDHHVQVHNK